MNRREFLKRSLLFAVGFCSSKIIIPDKVMAGQREFMGILVDTTRCIGCRSCEAACAMAHGLPYVDMGDEVFEQERKTSTDRWTVVNRYRTKKGDIFVKRQCMHCNIPACVSACLVKAMKKREEGHVTWEENCMGCRFCMYSCPFDAPKFEYQKSIPTIQKCNLCYDLYIKGKIPSCVEACPQEALIFGTRRELLLEARRRIAFAPDRYIPYIYGEREVGGTSFLYLSSVPFEEIGLRADLEHKPLPEYTTGFLYLDPFIFVLLPLFLLSLNKLTKKD